MNLLFITYHRTTSAAETGDVHMLTFEQFSHHIDLILEAGVTVADSRVLESDQYDTGHQVCITFDDGHKSDLVNAELLARHGLTAMFFISTANIGREGYLDENDIRRLHGMGMLIGSHSHQHKRLNKLPITEARTQLELSKQRLEAVLAHPVEYLALPGGGYNTRVVGVAKEVGFCYIMTTDWGGNAIAPGSTTGRLYRRNNILQDMTDRDFTSLLTLKSRHRRRLTFLVKQWLRALLPESAYGALRHLILRNCDKTTL